MIYNPGMAASPVLLFLLLHFASAQTSHQPVAVEGDEVWKHRIGRAEVVHEKLPPRYFARQVCLNVVVDTTGQVESVQPKEGPVDPPWAMDPAEAMEKTRRFRPFTRNGVAVRATFEDCVDIVPPVEWASHRMPFPEIKSWDTLRIKLTRTGCYGSCPEYSVEIQGDGHVLFDGEQNVLMLGHHTGWISKDAVTGLVDQFRAVDYFSLKGEYVSMTTDLPTYTTSIEFDGIKKSVKDYQGLYAGMPEGVPRLESEIDRAAGTDKWIEETPETGPALINEGWDFKANSPENLALFTRVIYWKLQDLIQLFVRNGAPVLEDGASPLVAAISTGNIALVSQFIGNYPRLPAPILACAVGAAVGAGNFPILRILIDKGGKMSDTSCKNSAPLVISAAASGNPDMLNEVLKYHPDVNATLYSGETAVSVLFEVTVPEPQKLRILATLIRAGANVNVRSGYDDETPMFKACDTYKAVPLLAKAGADLNARNKLGETPLMACFDPDYLKALVAAGADLTLRDNQGLTAAEKAAQIGDNATADFLKSLAGAPKH